MEPIPIWTPCEIDVLLHYYTTPERHEHDTAGAVVSAISRFIKDGMIQTDSQSASGYRVTEKGEFFITMLMSTPLPESAFVDPRTRSGNGS